MAERLLFRHWDSWKNGLRTHIWKVPVAGGGRSGHRPHARRQRRAAVFGRRRLRLRRLAGRQGLPLRVQPGQGPGALDERRPLGRPVRRGGRAADLTANNRAYDGTPKFSPGRRWIAWRAQKRPGLEADRFTLMVLERSSGRSRELTADFDDWVNEIAWAPDSKSIYFVSEEKGHGVIYRVPLDSGARSVVWRGGMPASVQPSADGKRIFFSASFLTRPAEIYSLSVEGGKPGTAAAVTHVNDAMWKEGNFGLNAAERWVDSADGRKLQAWLVLPPGFDPAKKYPAVVFIHGGPQGAWHDGWSTRWNPEVFAAYGYVVYAPNSAGSYGLRPEIRRRDLGDWGGKVFDDLMRQADDLASLPYVDKAKIGAAGASYGGYMINWMPGHTDRFEACLARRRVRPRVRCRSRPRSSGFRSAEFGGWPWNSELYEKWNPSRSTDKFKTPTLVVTSERDFRVPFGQGLQLFTALQLQNVPSKLLMFPDEGHWVLKPGNSRLWHATVMDWLHRYLGGAEADPKALEMAFSVSK